MPPVLDVARDAQRRARKEAHPLLPLAKNVNLWFISAQSGGGEPRTVDFRSQVFRWERKREPVMVPFPHLPVPHLGKCRMKMLVANKVGCISRTEQWALKRDGHRVITTETPHLTFD